MSRTRDRDVVEMAETVNILFNEGNTDPSVEEIANRHFGGKALGDDFLELVRKRLHRIRDVSVEDYGHEISLLSERYYQGFRHTPPKNKTEARKCIPIGGGNRAEGLRLHTSDDDLIWHATITIGVGQGAGKLSKQADRVLVAVQNGRVEELQAARMLQNAQRKAEPKNRRLAQKVMTFLLDAPEAT